MRFRVRLIVYKDIQDLYHSSHPGLDLRSCSKWSNTRLDHSYSRQNLANNRQSVFWSVDTDINLVKKIRWICWALRSNKAQVWWRLRLKTLYLISVGILTYFPFVLLVRSSSMNRLGSNLGSTDPKRITLVLEPFST